MQEPFSVGNRSIFFFHLCERNGRKVCLCLPVWSQVRKVGLRSSIIRPIMPKLKQKGGRLILPTDFLCVFVYFCSFISNTDIGPIYLFVWRIWWCCPVRFLAIYFADRAVYSVFFFCPEEQRCCCVWRTVSLLCFWELDLAFLLCLSPCQPPQKKPPRKEWKCGVDMLEGKGVSREQRDPWSNPQVQSS